MASQITSLTSVYSIVYSGADQRKYQSSASTAFVRGINRSPMNSPHKRPVTRKMFPFYDAIMWRSWILIAHSINRYWHLIIGMHRYLFNMIVYYMGRLERSTSHAKITITCDLYCSISQPLCTVLTPFCVCIFLSSLALNNHEIGQCHWDIP